MSGFEIVSSHIHSIKFAENYGHFKKNDESLIGGGISMLLNSKYNDAFIEMMQNLKNEDNGILFNMELCCKDNSTGIQYCDTYYWFNKKIYIKAAQQTNVYEYDFAEKPLSYESHTFFKRYIDLLELSKKVINTKMIFGEEYLMLDIESENKNKIFNRYDELFSGLYKMLILSNKTIKQKYNELTDAIENDSDIKITYHLMNDYKVYKYVVEKYNEITGKSLMFKTDDNSCAMIYLPINGKTQFDLKVMENYKLYNQNNETYTHAKLSSEEYEIVKILTLLKISSYGILFFRDIDFKLNREQFEFLIREMKETNSQIFLEIKTHSNLSRNVLNAAKYGDLLYVNKNDIIDINCELHNVNCNHLKIFFENDYVFVNDVHNCALLSSIMPDLTIIYVGINENMLQFEQFINKCDKPFKLIANLNSVYSENIFRKDFLKLLLDDSKETFSQLEGKFISKIDDLYKIDKYICGKEIIGDEKECKKQLIEYFNNICEEGTKKGIYYHEPRIVDFTYVDESKRNLEIINFLKREEHNCSDDETSISVSGSESESGSECDVDTDFEKKIVVRGEIGMAKYYYLAIFAFFIQLILLNCYVWYVR